MMGNLDYERNYWAASSSLAYRTGRCIYRLEKYLKADQRHVPILRIDLME